MLWFLLILLCLLCAAGAIFGLFQAYKEQAKLKSQLNFQKSQAAKSIQEKKQQLTNQINQELDQKFQQLNKNYQEKENQFKELENQYSKSKVEIEQKIEKDRAAAQDKLVNLIEEIQNQKHQSIQEIENNYQQQKEQIKLNFDSYNNEISNKISLIEKQIKEIVDQKEKVIVRLQEEERIKNERDYFKISISQNLKEDIGKLKNLVISFNNKNVIYKLIWEVYYKAQIEALFKKILGENDDKGGIYKITNINNEKIYIGRAVNFKERWRTHAKRGCGIDPIKSLLYDAMMEEGLENFTWEVVEICSKEEQPAREKYWINFYHSDSYGYNQNKGG